jgi:aconitate hydratase
MHEVADKIELASILSGNRNFDGRISPDVSQNYLCAPALVVAYSLVGTMDFDFATQPLGTDAEGRDVFLADIWPDRAEVQELLAACCTKATFDQAGEGLFDGSEQWRALSREASDTFAWDPESTYVRRAPYFDGMGKQPSQPEPIAGARALLNLGDFITTDHISPAGSIADGSPAARYLEEHGVAKADFNTYGARRGNHEVMMRGTFANVKLMNKLADGRKGGWTLDQLDGQIKPVWDAAEHYMNEGISSVVLAGKMYGSGSSRDWAAKGPMLQGVRAAFAESFERIHRSNLIGMGILPLQFKDGESVGSLGLDGTELFTVGAIDFSHGLPDPALVPVVAERADGTRTEFEAVVRIDTPTEGQYYVNGGILQYVLRSLA